MMVSEMCFRVIFNLKLIKIKIGIRGVDLTARSERKIIMFPFAPSPQPSAFADSRRKPALAFKL